MPGRAPCYGTAGQGERGNPMKPTNNRPGAAGGRGQPQKPTTFAPPTPKVTRQKPAKVLTAAERAAFLASRPDLKPKS